MTQNELYTRLYEAIKDEYPSAQISLVNVNKQSGFYKGLQVAFDRGALNPVFNIEQITHQVKTEEDLEKMSKAVVEEIKKAVVYPLVDLNILKDYDKLKEHLCVDVIPVKGNEELLKNAPSQRFGRDMAIIAKAVLTDYQKQDRFPIITIDDNIMLSLGESSSTLLKDAIENSSKINPPEIMSVSDFLYGDFQESAETSFADNAKYAVCILMTQTGICPSSAMVNKETLQELAQKLNGNFYLVPSSLGGIAIPEWEQNAKKLAVNHEKALSEIGDKSIGEMLFYDKDEKTLEPVSAIEERVRKEMERGQEQTVEVNRQMQVDKGRGTGMSR